MPRRSAPPLGQHFLVSDAICRRIVALLGLRPDDTVVEIGPGEGILTRALLDTGARVVAVELDRLLADRLERRLGGDRLIVVQQDFLAFDPGQAGEFPFALVGNIPYSITSPVIEWLIRHRDAVTVAVCMVQREPALRITAGPGGKNWSPLAVFTQIHFHAELCFTVSPDYFRPPPKVHSAVIRLRPRPQPLLQPDELFETVVRQAFRQRRKLLANNLSPALLPDAAAAKTLLRELGWPENIRAEQLSIEQFLTLTERLRKNR